MNFNAGFTRFAEKVTYLAGTWQHTAAWTAAIAAWLILGPAMHFSDSWQLMANTPTTLVELYLGLFILVAENHSRKAEASIQKLQEDHNKLMIDLLSYLKTEDDEIKSEVDALVGAKE